MDIDKKMDRYSSCNITDMQSTELVDQLYDNKNKLMNEKEITTTANQQQQCLVREIRHKK